MPYGLKRAPCHIDAFSQRFCFLCVCSRCTDRCGRLRSGYLDVLLILVRFCRMWWSLWFMVYFIMPKTSAFIGINKTNQPIKIAVR